MRIAQEPNKRARAKLIQLAVRVVKTGYAVAKATDGDSALLREVRGDLLREAKNLFHDDIRDDDGDEA